jgi:cell division protease FtsH
MSQENKLQESGEDRPTGDDGPASNGKPKPRGSRGLLYMGAFLACLLLIALVLPGSLSGDAERSPSEVYELLRADKIKPKSLYVILVGSDPVSVGGEIDRTPAEIADGKTVRFEILVPTEATFDAFRTILDELDLREKEKGSDTRYVLQERASTSVFWDIVGNLLFIFMFIGLFYFLVLRQFRTGGPSGNVFSFGKSRARIAEKGSSTTCFDDVAGIDEAKSEVQEIIEFLKSPDKFLRLGGRIPRGVLLAGAPGTGKTLLAKAIAGEANVPFYSISGSDFVEMFVGVGASRVRDLFRQARENSPCTLFLDEIDAVGRRRGAGLGGGHDEREQTLNAILVEMDGFESDASIVVVAATNRPDVLDPALLRPGRFDREIYIDLPDIDGREAILRVHTCTVKLDDDTDHRRLARLTPTFSGAELAAMVNEAAIIAVMKEQETIRQVDFEAARDKIRFGREKKSRHFTDDDRRITAYHEAGHAIAAHLLPEAEPLHKVTIIPRGMALGATMQMPERDRYHLSRKHLLANLIVLYAGRVAEEVFFDDITAGARNDIERATDIARRMVCEWGMSEALGPIDFGQDDETPFMGREPGPSRRYSEATAIKIDEEIRRIVDEAVQKTEKIVRKHRKEVERIAEALLERETVTGDEVDILVNGGEITPHVPEDPAVSVVTSSEADDSSGAS